MSRKLNKPPKKGETAPVTVSMSGELITLVDRKAAALQAAEPGSVVTRSDVIRRAIYMFVKVI
jgi:hypothetical protein